ncbi:hypothetical protein [Polaromonas sp. C04]|uniref:hypothetical protein n=1 Tax=Polaromonas sp. C04 TaxID=1945857 RepID=UPI00098582CA|nr:hypothetical protein [Polaromonas sp. C04]OOG55973.1 hypothetical protein B0E49_06325 [Polaromonas sp. C04]
MDLQNLAYALTQVAHNFGAVTVVAVPLYVVSAGRPERERRVLWLVLSGWAVQIASGALFGLVSLHFYGQLPDIHDIAAAALAVKVLCAVTAVGLIIVLLRSRAVRIDRRAALIWRMLAALGMTALAAAAFLRWFS